MFVRSLALGALAVAMISTSAMAADLIIPTTPVDILPASGFSWDGLYAGVQGGGEFYDDPTYGVIGAHIGVNFVVASPLLVGLEGTAEWLIGDDFNFGDFYANVRVGALVTDQVLVYALAGTGVEFNEDDDSIGIYQLGGGVELAVTDAVSVRGQIVGTGIYDNDDFLEGTKATVGVSYHF